MKYLKLYIGTKTPDDKKVITQKVIRVDLFHNREVVKDLVSRSLDEIFDQYDESEGFDTEDI